MVLQPMAEEGGLSRRALGIEHDRQIAAEPHRIHVVEEEGTMPAEQVLHIVLGGREQHVDAGLVHETVEPRGVEGGWHDRCSWLRMFPRLSPRWGAGMVAVWR
jgi:hypothetical protein